MKKYIFVLLFIGLILRIAISFQNYSGDVTNHMIWGETAVKQGLKGLYDKDFYKLYGHISPNYPPITILLFAFLYLVKLWIYQFAWFLNLHIPVFPSKLIFFLKDFDYYPYLLKLPAILSDIGIAYITYLFAKKIVGKKKSTWPLIATSFVILNPAYFYNSAYWGQTDSIPLFFLLISFYSLIFIKKFSVSAILFTFGILSKQTVIIFTPLFLLSMHVISNAVRNPATEGSVNKKNYATLDFSVVSLLRNDKVWVFIKTLLVPLLVFWLFFLPFYKQGILLIYPFITFWNKILLTSGLPYTSNHAFNFWYLLNGSRTTLASSKFILNISYEIWGYLIAGFISVLVLLKLFRNRFQSRYIFYTGFLIPFISFLFLTKMHERHLILTLPFLLIATYNNKFLLISYLFISLFNFLNMYHNWWSPPLPFIQEVLSLRFVINSSTLLLIGFFFILLVNHFKKNFLREKSK